MQYPSRKRRYFSIVFEEGDEDEDEDAPMLAESEEKREEQECPAWLIIFLIVLAVIGAGIGLYFGLQPGETTETPGCVYGPYGTCNIKGKQFRGSL